MNGEDQTRGGLYASAAAIAPEHRARRRKQALVALAGAAAVLAGAGFLMTQLMSTRQEILPQPAAVAPLTYTSAAPPTPAPAPEPWSTRGDLPAQPFRRSPTPEPSVEVSAEVEAARSAAAAAGHPLRRPPTPSPGVAVADAPAAERTVRTGEGTMRVVEAAYDLSGQRELLWAGDRGTPVGTARCTQTLRFDSAATPRERPSMLLCWRTSATKSVVTVAVARTGRPRAVDSVAVIDKEWAGEG